MTASSWLLLFCCESASRGWSTSWGQERVIWSPSSGRAFTSSAARLLQVSGVRSAFCQPLCSFPMFLINAAFDFPHRLRSAPSREWGMFVISNESLSESFKSVLYISHCLCLFLCSVLWLHSTVFIDSYSSFTFRLVADTLIQSERGKILLLFHDHVWVCSNVLMFSSVCVFQRLGCAVEWTGSVNF